MRKKKIYLSQISARNGQLTASFLKGNLLAVEALLFKKIGRAHMSLIGQVFDTQAHRFIEPKTVIEFDKVDKTALLALINAHNQTTVQADMLELTAITIGGHGFAFVKATQGSPFRGTRLISFNAANGQSEFKHYSFTTPEPEEWSYEDDGKCHRVMSSAPKLRARNREAAYLHWKSSVNLLAAATQLQST